MSGPGQESRFRSLDGLRGAAALAVALCHFVTAFQGSIINGDPASSHFPADLALSHTPLIILYNSDLCIAIFFILSGFVLAAGVTASAAPLPALIVRRWVRLAIPVMASSVVAFAIPAFGLNFAQTAAVFAKSGWLGQQYAFVTPSAAAFGKLLVVSFIGLLYPDQGWHTLGRVLLYPEQGWGTLARFYNSSLWTMPVECAGSLALFMAYRAPFSPGSYGRLGITAVLSALLWPTPFFGFPLGCLLFEIHRMVGPAPRLPARFVGLFGGSVFVLGVILGGTPFEINLAGGGVYATLAVAVYRLTAPLSAVTALHQAGALCLVASALLWAPLCGLLETRLLQFLGRISFMVYLLQVPVLCCVGAGLVAFFTPWLGYNPATIVAGLADLTATLAAAALFTRFVDRPAIGASHRLSAALTSRWGKRPATPALLSDSR